MSDFVLHKGRRSADQFSKHYGAEVTQITYTTAGSPKIGLNDGRTGEGACLGCGHAPCMEKDVSELVLTGGLEAFPGDPSLDVCPTGAIGRDKGGFAAIVDRETCIGCGLCAVRCPYGAISLADGEAAKVLTQDPQGLIRLQKYKGPHANPKRNGTLAALTAPAASGLPAAVAALDERQSALLIRNLLHEVGVNARVRRRGDTNVRIDLLGYTRSGRILVGEIELSAAVLESPRALLEDVAILNARYGIPVSDIDPLSVILSFPNVRSEYYQVMRDIEKVLELRCRTITVGALVALLWTTSKLDGFNGNSFAFSDGIEVDLKHSLGEHLSSLPEPYAGAFRPAK